MFKTIMLLIGLSVMVYFGAYGEIEGLKNVSFVGLWLFTIIFAIGALFGDLEKHRPSLLKTINKWYFYSIIFALLYGGLVAIGTLILLSIFIAKIRIEGKKK